MATMQDLRNDVPNAGVGSGHADPDSRSIQQIARLTGFLYLAIVVFSIFSVLVLESVVSPGDAATTSSNIQDGQWLFGSSLGSWVVVVAADLCISITLYLLLAPISHGISLLAAALRLVYSAMLGANLVSLYDAYLWLTDPERGAGFDDIQVQNMALSDLESFNAGFLLALVFFGMHLLVVGFLFFKSRYIPEAISVLLMAAGVGYIVDSMANFFVDDYGGVVSALMLAPAVLGEFGLTAWLLVKGVKVDQPG